MTSVSSTPWTLADLGDLTGKRFVVTGPTAGLGTHTARELAKAGAEVVLVGRSAEKLAKTSADIAAVAPGAALPTVRVDMSDQTSVRQGAAEIAALGPIDVLINNAGVMALPYARTVDGFEMQLGTNHLGPFLLTGLLLPRLVESGDGRVIAVASNAHKTVTKPPLGDPRVQEGRYSKWRAYGGSKLANLMFTFELDRRLRGAGLPVIALAAHPGYAATELVGKTGGFGGRFMDLVTGVIGQPADMGALPTLMAATADLPGSTYIGPKNLGEMKGPPVIVKARPAAYAEDVQRRLWELSEEATGIRYP